MTDADPGDLAIHWRYEVNGLDVTDALARYMAAERELRDVLSVSRPTWSDYPISVFTSLAFRTSRACYLVD